VVLPERCRESSFFAENFAALMLFAGKKWRPLFRCDRCEKTSAKPPRPHYSAVKNPGFKPNNSPCQQAIFFYLCASFFFYGPVAQLNRATAFNFGALNGKQNHLSGYHRIGEPFPAMPVGNTEETLDQFCILGYDLSSH